MDHIQKSLDATKYLGKANEIAGGNFPEFLINDYQPEINAGPDALVSATFLYGSTGKKCPIDFTFNFDKNCWVAECWGEYIEEQRLDKFLQAAYFNATYAGILD